MIIRKETAADYAAITEVTIAAFRTMVISNQTEHLIIDALRTSGGLTISLVAELEQRVVGHVAFSPVAISDGTAGWHGLGPVSVLPGYQRQGIGKMLINKGLTLLKDMHSQGCALVGDPNYYNHFGFHNIPDVKYQGIPQEFFLILPFTEKIPQGTVRFHEAFSVKH